jgi:hypothetical protein
MLLTSKQLRIIFYLLFSLFTVVGISPANAQTPEQYRYAQIRKIIKQNLHLSAHMVKAVDTRTIEAVKKKVTDADIPILVKMLNDKEHVVMIGAQHVLAAFNEKAIIPLTQLTETEPSYSVSPAKDALNEIHEHLSRTTATDAGENIVHGTEDAFKLKAPTGWMLYKINLPVERIALYPKGQNWNGSFVKMFADNQNKSAKNVEELSEIMLTKLRKQFDRDLQINKDKPIQLSDNKQAVVYFYTNEKNPHYFAIAFIESPSHTFHLIMLDGRYGGKKIFDESLPAFEAVVKSYQAQ